MSRENILSYIENKMTISGVTVNRIIQEDAEDFDKDFVSFPLIEIQEGNELSSPFTSGQVNNELEILLTLYTQGYTPTLINGIVQSVKDFFRNDYKLGNNVTMVIEVESDKTISGDGEMQGTEIIAKVHYRELYSI